MSSIRHYIDGVHKKKRLPIRQPLIDLLAQFLPFCPRAVSDTMCEWKSYSILHHVTVQLFYEIILLFLRRCCPGSRIHMGRVRV